MSTPRIDVVTIFPEFFNVLDVSLIGRARESGTLGVNVHDLRTWTTDRHRTVDDTPAGGGAGMVMRPDIWGAALDDVLGEDATLIIPTPGGQPFTQDLARELAAELAAGGQLVIACGRYEGIDARVGEHYATRGRVREISIGDYVLNGGESAAMVLIEAVGRLVPGVVGNPESLIEESHGEDGLLEYPVYTVPPEWRGLEVPDVLRSGNHARISAWRRAKSLHRTATVRPDLLARHPVQIRRARPSDGARLNEIAQRTFVLACPPGFPGELAAEFVAENLSETQFRQWAKSRGTQVWVAQVAGVVVAYAVVHLRSPAPELPEQDPATTAELSKFYTLPEHHGSGTASALMEAVLEGAAEAGMRQMWLGVNQFNARAVAFYQRQGFEIGGDRTFVVGGDVHDDFVMVRTLNFATED